MAPKEEAKDRSDSSSELAPAIVEVKPDDYCYDWGCCSEPLTPAPTPPEPNLWCSQCYESITHDQSWLGIEEHPGQYYHSQCVLDWLMEVGEGFDEWKLDEWSVGNCWLGDEVWGTKFIGLGYYLPNYKEYVRELWQSNEMAEERERMWSEEEAEGGLREERAEGDEEVVSDNEERAKKEEEGVSEKDFAAFAGKGEDRESKGLVKATEVELEVEEIPW